MKRLVEEVEGEGLDGLLGESIMVFCCRYIYAGKLLGVNDTCIKLGSAEIVYETGALAASTWKDAQPLPDDLYIDRGAIESFGRSGRACDC